MRELRPPPSTARILSRREREQLSDLQASVHTLGATRATALRMFTASRHAATPVAQREFWLEFVWVDQEYRIAVQRLARFCLDRRESVQRPLRMA